MIGIMRAIGALAIAIIAFGVSTSRADTTDDKQVSDQLFIEGRKLLDSDPAAACKKFHEAQAHQKDRESVAILLNLGLCYEKQGKIATSLKWYRKVQTVANESQDSSDDEYEDAAKQATGRLATKVAKVTFVFGPGTDNVDVVIDGETKVERTELIVELDAGSHEIVSSAPGKTAKTDTLVIEDGQSLTQSISALADAPVTGPNHAGRGRKILGIVVGAGVPAVCIAIGLPWGLSVQSDFKNSRPPYNSGNEEDDHDLAKKKLLKIDLAFGAVAAVGIGAGIWLYYSGIKEHRAAARQMAFTPVVSSDEAGFALSGRF